MSEQGDDSELERGCIESMKHNAQRMREQCHRERGRAEKAERELAELRARLASWAAAWLAEDESLDDFDRGYNAALRNCARQLRAEVGAKP